METTTQHPLSQAFIQQASVIIGHRQEIRGVQPLNQTDIQRECDNIKAVSPRILQAGLDGEDGVYFFKYRLQGEAIQTHCEAADSPAVALYYGVKALKSDGISCKLSFPKPVIKDFRPSPLTQQQEVSARRDLGVLFINFKDDVDEALVSTLQIDSQLNLLEAILNDFENAYWDDEVTGGILARRTIGEAQEWVENQYQFKAQEIGALSNDEKRTRSIAPQNIVDTEVEPYPTYRLTMKELALREIYEGRGIHTLEAANRIARESNYTSGQKLLDDFNKFRGNATNRTGFENTREINWMVGRIKRLLPLLSEKAKQQAKSEMETLIAALPITI